MMSDHIEVPLDQLRKGMFVILKLSWLEHPFAFNSFVIQTEAQVETLRSLGLQTVEVSPLRSQTAVMPVQQVQNSLPPAAVLDAPDDKPAADASATKKPAIGQKSPLLEKHHQLREDIAEAGRQAVRAAQVVRQTSREFISRPTEAAAAAQALIADITASLMSSGDVMVHLLGDRVAGEEVYCHALNVSVLSLLLGKSLELDATQLHVIGLAAVFHDLGKLEMPSRILMKSEALNHAEEELLRQHSRLGAELALRGELPEPVVTAILQHHEHVDGSGYPHGLTADKIILAAKVVAIVNHYDNLCNPVSPSQALTPYEALSTMYAKRKGWFDQGMLGRLVHVLGVYPPGSLVQLSNGKTAMVVSVNAARPLQPSLLVYDAAVPKSEALVLDLEKNPAINIRKALRPAALDLAAHEYLCPRERVAYYYGKAAAEPAKTRD